MKIHAQLLAKQSVTAKKISKKVQATIKCGKKMATQTEAIQTQSKLVQVGDGAVKMTTNPLRTINGESK